MEIICEVELFPFAAFFIYACTMPHVTFSLFAKNGRRVITSHYIRAILYIIFRSRIEAMCVASFPTFAYLPHVITFYSWEKETFIIGRFKYVRSLHSKEMRINQIMSVWKMSQSARRGTKKGIRKIGRRDKWRNSKSNRVKIIHLKHSRTIDRLSVAFFNLSPARRR